VTLTLLDVAPVLPLPDSERWRPLRAGICNVWQYENQVFEFQAGNLILRGENKTGKSKALELLLPFLLDCSIDPRRLDPFGAQSKTMRWNLLEGDGVRDVLHTSRDGFVWLEFGRNDDAGAPRYFTIGARLKASNGTEDVTIHFFHTTLRVGDGLALLVPGTSRPMNPEAFADAVGSSGEVLDARGPGRRERYRAAVNARLFGLEPDRYRGLIELLLNLRQPHLAERLHPDEIHRFLTGALPPLDPVIVAEQAESLEGLRRHGENLEGLRGAVRTVGDFLAVYHDYVARVARLRAAAVRVGNSAWDTGAERERRGLRRHEWALDAVRDARTAIDALEEGITRLEGRIEALEHSETRRSAEALVREQEEAVRLDGEARSAEERARRAEASREERAGRLAAARGIEAVRGTDRSRASDLVTERARSAGVDEELGLLGDQHALDPSAWLGSARGAVRARRDAIAALRSLRTAEASAATNLRVATEALEAAVAATADAGTRVSDATALLERRESAFLAAVRAWASSLVELRLPADVSGQLEAALDEGRPTGPLLAGLATGSREALASERAAVAHARSVLDDEIAGLRAEITRLESAREIDPEPTPFRDRVGRAERAGAPFHRAVDFARSLAAGERAGLESALAASGILDAWIMPDGALLPAGARDATLLPAGRTGARETLASALVPVPGVGVDATIVAGILEAIGYGESPSAPVWVAADGRFRLGPLAGTFRKGAAEYIGAGAQEQARRRRIGEIGARVRALEVERSARTDELAALERRGVALRAEIAAAPGEGDLVAARAELAEAERGHLRAQAAETGARTRSDRAAAAHIAAVTALRDAAREHGLLEQLGRLDELLESLRDLEAAIEAFRGAVELHAQAVAHAGELAGLVERAAADALTLAGEAASARDAATRQRSLFETLEAKVGAPVRALLADLAATREEHRVARVDLGTARESLADAMKELGIAENGMIDLRRELEGLDEARKAAAARFVDLAELDLLGLVVPDAELSGAPADWSFTRALELARAVDAATSTLAYETRDIDAATDATHARFTKLQSELGTDYRVEMRHEDEVFVPFALRDGLTRSMTDLRAELEAAVAETEALLERREQEVFRDFLLSRVGRHMGELIRAAHDLVDEMNEQLVAAVGDGGRRVWIKWDVRQDAREETKSAVKLLRRDPAMLEDEHWQTLIEFFRERVREARDDPDDRRPWADKLAAAIDYRSWHAFELDEQTEDGRRRRMTTRTHGTGSGGEKSVMLHLPLFAALAAHYGSAMTAAPRLIMLDEAFAGIDRPTRGRLFGLMRAFGFCAFLTGHEEWGTYPEVEGAGIYLLARDARLRGVTATHFTWDGHARHLVS